MTKQSIVDDLPPLYIDSLSEAQRWYLVQSFKMFAAFLRRQAGSPKASPAAAAAYRRELADFSAYAADLGVAIPKE